MCETFLFYAKKRSAVSEGSVPFMSLFDDDFYSTKATRQRPWKHKGRNVFSGLSGVGGFNGLAGFADRKRTVILLAGIGGALLMLLLLWVVGAMKSGHEGANLAVPASASADMDTQQVTNDAVVAATEKIKPAVVSVISMKSDTDNRDNGIGIGSGVVFDRDGDRIRIVTNNHVVENGNDFEIVNAKGEHRKATLVGRDQITDLAVLEADGTDMKVIAEFGDSDQLRAGETAIAVGNPLGLGYSPTVTKGIISSPKRTIPVSLTHGGDYDWEMDVIQTDAAINQGNSGGPLVNIEGKVIGINSLKIADMGVEGLGFAIPVNEAKPIIDSLLTDHKVKRPLLGVSTQELQAFSGTDVLKLPDDVKTGVIVFEVTGPSKEAGLKPQDVIVQLDDRKIDTTIALRKYLYNEKKIGDDVKVTFYRAGKKMTATVTLAEAGDP